MTQDELDDRKVLEELAGEQKKLIHLQNAIIDKQRCELAYFRQFEMCYKHPVGFVLWLHLQDVWPFSLLWR